MATVSLRAAWEVRGGVVPGHPLPEFTKTFLYTSSDYAVDSGDPQPQTDLSIFQKQRQAALDYFTTLNDPRSLNWADITFIWY